MTFITFEGMDGAGKSSTSVQVAERLAVCGHRVRHIDKKGIGLEDPYLVRHAEAVRTLIWGYPSTAPIGKLGDGHWLHLMASWFHLLDDTVVKPALASGQIVVVDSWIGKFMARFALKSPTRDEQARAAFAGLSVPDLTVFLDVEPVVAAGRKREFTIAECGNIDGLVGANAGNFIAYQSRVRSALSAFAAEWNWSRIDTTHRPQDDVVSLAVEILERHLATARLDVAIPD